MILNEKRSVTHPNHLTSPTVVTGDKQRATAISRSKWLRLGGVGKIVVHLLGHLKTNRLISIGWKSKIHQRKSGHLWPNCGILSNCWQNWCTHVGRSLVTLYHPLFWPLPLEWPMGDTSISSFLLWEGVIYCSNFMYIRSMSHQPKPFPALAFRLPSNTRPNVFLKPSDALSYMFHFSSKKAHLIAHIIQSILHNTTEWRARKFHVGKYLLYKSKERICPINL